MLAASGMSGACFILNSSAGGGYDERWLTRNGDALGGLGSDTRVMLACGGDEILKAARAAVSGGCSLLVAAGGDGTVSAVASQLVNSGV
ncbi:MAG TPA: diacylglycerol kinase family protein, partial [Burkholderiaceae bacterium]|nr:diacylglycerol kinase family protein [Burkholderiaceae bacterium]